MRKEIHLRNIELRAFERDDGLFEVVGRLIDQKPHELRLPIPHGPRPVPANVPMHDVTVRVMFDEEMLVREVDAATTAAPYDVCFGAPATVAAMKGLTLSAGWVSEVRKRLGGAQGCTHMAEVLIAIATVAYQALTVHRWNQPERTDANGRPLKLESCYAYGLDREVVMKRYPRFYTGEQP